MLINKEFAHARDVFPEVKKFHFFDRQYLQSEINTLDSHMFFPILELRQFLDELKLESFTQIYNFTHNRLSAYLIHELASTQVFGLSWNGKSFNPFKSMALRTFNSCFSAKIPFPLHYSEALSAALDLPVNFYLQSTVRSKGEIWFQVDASDKKKQWPLWRFRKLADLIYSKYPGQVIKVLSSGNNLEQLRTYFEPDEIEIMSLQEIINQSARVRILVSLDTSILHLLGLFGIPSLQIALGGADFQRTGPLLGTSLILSSEVHCYPCGHSGRCHQSSHLCGDSLSEETAFLAIQKYFGEQVLIKQNGFNLHEVLWTPLGWSAKNAGQNTNSESYQQYLFEKQSISHAFDLPFIPLNFSQKLLLDRTQEQVALEIHLAKLWLKFRVLIQDFRGENLEIFKRTVQEAMSTSPFLRIYTEVLGVLIEGHSRNALTYLGEAQTAIKHLENLLAARRYILTPNPEEISAKQIRSNIGDSKNTVRGLNLLDM